jgi:hypothetical protein
VADGTGLENRKGFTLLVGSNPTPSALKEKRFAAVSSVKSLHETSKNFWEASPSPVHGTRLLSGRGVKPPRGFKSLRLRRVEILIVWSTIKISILPYDYTSNQALVAQRIEHLTTDQKVRGSNPFGRT